MNDRHYRALCEIAECSVTTDSAWMRQIARTALEPVANPPGQFRAESSGNLSPEDSGPGGLAPTPFTIGLHKALDFYAEGNSDGGMLARSSLYEAGLSRGPR